MMQILRAYDLHKATVIALMMLYQNTKSTVRWNFEKRYISTISVYNLIISLRSMNVTRSNKENAFTQKRQEADHIPQKLSQTQRIQMIWHFLHMLLPKLNPYGMAWSKRQEAVTIT